MAYQFYFSINGKTQGQFRGESLTKSRREKWLTGLGFQYEIKSPRDIASGQQSGKRQHSPITVTKEWGAATPQIFTALVNNEILKEVVFEFSKTNANGEEYVFHTIKLTNANVSDIRQFTETPAQDGSPGKHTLTADARVLEAVSFTFSKIEVENKDGKTMATDDWSAH